MSVTLHTAQFGLSGLGVMGENLARNIDDHGYSVALWTHTEGKVQRFIERSGAERRWIGTRTLEEFTAALAPPRRILLRRFFPGSVADKVVRGASVPVLVYRPDGAPAAAPELWSSPP